ncbi:hypothetical protein M440DRAFT_1267668 [Trichoderma longibrachiatum ATCC 18648]|uniref:Uncharacterized protein n=1 Tax=Trichoderma longibrachiatum ATCC 18648 TaxID=983965 RepID=A0A2T4C0E2_TRILO|nr:hypothetical protein M440DRAFT_1267668 [Trichoderma longibrachiatum ATCC 18648]
MRLNQPSLSWFLKGKRHQPPASISAIVTTTTALCRPSMDHRANREMCLGCTSSGLGRPRDAASPTGAWRRCANACCCGKQSSLAGPIQFPWTDDPAARAVSCQTSQPIPRLDAQMSACCPGMGSSTCQGISTFSWAEPSRPNESCPRQVSRNNSASCRGVCALPVRQRTHDLFFWEG